MIWEGNLLKMRATHNRPVSYSLDNGSFPVLLNQLLGSEVKLEYMNRINCIRCGKTTRTSFGQGYCYPCFLAAPETEDCVLRPELCRAHLGESRDMDYARSHCLIEHCVYLADSGGIKVGVTRHTQVPVRWIDQGATAAVRIARTPDRYTAGSIEVALKPVFSDKTNWRNMLRFRGINSATLLENKEKAWRYLPEEFQPFYENDDDICEIDYPVIRYPESVTSVSLDKTHAISGMLLAIIGQYLVWADGKCLNIRKHSGYLVRITAG